MLKIKEKVIKYKEKVVKYKESNLLSTLLPPRNYTTARELLFTLVTPTNSIFSLTFAPYFLRKG